MRCLTLLCLLLCATVAQAADLRIGTRAEPTLDPHYLWTDANSAYYTQIYGALTVTNRDAKVEPGLAVSWAPISDTEWRFRLRDGVKFQDGTPFTAQDVVDSYTRMRTIKAAATFAGAIPGLKDVTAIDEHTIAITTEQPAPTLPQRVSLIQILPSNIAKTATGGDFTDGRAVTGTGPYRLVSFRPGDSLVLERNPTYWGPPAKWDRVTFKFITDPGARVAALLGHDVDMIDAVPPALVPRLRDEPNVNLVTGPSSRVLFLAPDTARNSTPFVKSIDGQPLAHNPLKDRRVREALSLAIDRAAITAKVMNGLGTPAGQITPPGFGGYDESIPVPKPDPARARSLLAEAGYPKGFEITASCPNDRFVEDAKICQALGQMFSRIGLKVNVDTSPYAVYAPRAMDPNGPGFSLPLLGWADSAGEALVLAACIHSPEPAKKMGTWNWGHYSNPAVDKFIEDASRELNPATRYSELAQAMKLAMDDYAVIPLHLQSTVVATRKGLSYQTWLTEATVADSVVVQ